LDAARLSSPQPVDAVVAQRPALGGVGRETAATINSGAACARFCWV
jgi:hypothetical protein